MRAFAVQKFSEAPAIHELRIPAADGAFLKRRRSAGVTPMPSSLIQQLHAASPYPFVMGIDFAGVVERVPPGERFPRRDRIFGMARTHGAYASTPWCTGREHRTAGPSPTASRRTGSRAAHPR
jgi:NADPH:quinone reductase-like Zn-dependent oxidoreductase